MSSGPNASALSANGRGRTQERGRATRAALVEAAVESLVEVGYSATTTIEVARRAGVSRGAQLHHFPTRADLLAAAVGELYERRMQEFAEALRHVPPGSDRVDHSIDMMWEMFRGPTFVAWAEVWLAARTDPDLRAAVLSVDRVASEHSATIFDQVFADVSGVTLEEKEVAHSFAYVVMAGLAFQQLLAPEHYADPETIVEALKLLAHVDDPLPPNQPKPFQEEAQ